MSKDDVFSGEWTAEQWQKAWNIRVGRAYGCSRCGAVIMVTKGGVGNLEPICCKQAMRPLSESQPSEPEGNS